MPLPMIHLKVAYSVQVQCPLTNLDMPQYYVGVLAPDGAHNRENYNYLVDRRQAHLEDNDTSQWLKNIITLISTKKMDRNYSFYLGYAVHLMTDIYWQETVSAKFHQLYNIANNLPFENERRAYSAEMSHIDIQLYANENMKNELWGYLQSAVGIDFLPYVSAAEIETEKAITLLWYDNKQNYPVYYPDLIEYQDVIDFIDYSAALVVGNLR